MCILWITIIKSWRTPRPYQDEKVLKIVIFNTFCYPIIMIPKAPNNANMIPIELTLLIFSFKNRKE